MKRRHLIALAAVLTISSCASRTSGIDPETQTSSETRESSSLEAGASGTTASGTLPSSAGSPSTTPPASSSEETSGTTSGTTPAAATGVSSTTTRKETSASSAGSAGGATREETSAAAPAEPVGTIRNEITYEYVGEPTASPDADESFADSIAGESFFESDSLLGDISLPFSPAEKAEIAAADSIAGGEFSAEAPSGYFDGCDYDYDYAYPAPQQPAPRAGLLTGGEWRDSENFDFWKNLIGQRSKWSELARNWRLCTVNRIAVQVTANQTPAENVTVKLWAGETPIWEAVTDNRGNAYLFKTLDEKSQSLPTRITAERGGKQLAFAEYREGESCTLTISEETPRPKGLDLMFVIDTTGSMDDELIYLQAELEGVINRITKEKQISARLGLNFYRDSGDEYVVRGCDFSDDIRRTVSILNEQSADGGGDYPEAVERALSCAVYEQSWNEDSVKLLFLVLDAPPHYTEENVETLRTLLADAARKGIRIIPVASSGVDTETEFLCRSFSLATGGTYTFLTDHSGIGGGHLEPTIGSYQVEKLNDLLVRIIEGYLSR